MPTTADRYAIRVGWSEEDESFLASCPEFPTLSAFGDTAEEALQEGRILLEEFLAFHKEKGWPLPRPLPAPGTFSGKILVRMPRSLHASLAEIAEAEGVSLNQLIVSRLSGAAVKMPL